VEKNVAETKVGMTPRNTSCIWAVPCRYAFYVMKKEIKKNIFFILWPGVNSGMNISTVELFLFQVSLSFVYK